MVRLIIIVIMLLSSYIGFSQTSKIKKKLTASEKIDNISNTDYKFNDLKIEVLNSKFTFDMKTILNQKI